MSVPYYAGPGFEAPPFLATLDVIEDLTDSKCWKCDTTRDTRHHGLCDPCYDYLRDPDDGTP